MKKVIKFVEAFVSYKISLKELYFSLSTWLVLLISFLAVTTKFHTSLLLANVIIALIFYLVITLITNRILLSGFITLLLAVSFDYIKQIKWQFLMQEMSAADFFMLKLLLNHGLMRLIYQYATKEIYLIILLLLVNFILLWNKSDTLLDKTKVGIKNYYALKLISFGVAVLLVMKLADIATDKNSHFYRMLSSLKSQEDYYPRRIYGPFADVLFTMHELYIEPIATSASASLIIDKIKNNHFTPQSPGDMPDIVVILNESTFDPSKLDYGFADKLYFKFFEKNKYTKYGGILNVNTYGGSSWISEYEINTGIPHKYFTGPSYMPFITLVPRTKNSLIAYLRSIGYQTKILYPIDKDFSLAQDAYSTLGAEEVKDIYDYDYKPEGWSEVPDKVIGDMIMAELERDPDKPKYIFAATMLNHGPHSSYFRDNIGCGRTMDDKLCSKLNDYLSRLTNTDKDQIALVQKLMTRKRKTILVNFGDHLPSFEGYSTQLRFKREIKDYYKTFYQIDANFDLPKHENYEFLDITLISGLILDIAKLNNDKFYLANSLIRKTCHGQVSECQSETNHDLLESYKSLVIKQLEF